MVLIDALGRSLQFIVPSKNVLPSFLGKRFCWTKVLDKARSVDDSAYTRRVALNVRPDGCELIFPGAPATGCEEAFSAGLNCDTVVSVKRIL